MPPEIEVHTAGWSGEGEFTQSVLARLRLAPSVRHIRVEDAPSSREEPGYLFISNEVFVGLQPAPRRWWPFGRQSTRTTSAAGLDMVQGWLEADPSVGRPDFADAGMLQYLRTQRIIPPYQARGYKLVEMVRVYLARSATRR